MLMEESISPIQRGEHSDGEQVCRHQANSYTRRPMGTWLLPPVLVARDVVSPGDAPRAAEAGVVVALERYGRVNASAVVCCVRVYADVWGNGVSLRQQVVLVTQHQRPQGSTRNHECVGSP